MFVSGASSLYVSTGICGNSAAIAFRSARRTSMSIATAIALVACAPNRPPPPRRRAGRHGRPLWHGRTPDARAAAHYDYLMREGISKLEKIPHNQGVDVLTRSRDGVTEFTVISYCSPSSATGVRSTTSRPRPAATSRRPTTSRATPRCCLELEPNVRHFEVRNSVRQ
jgi:hypothetical protein